MSRADAKKRSVALLLSLLATVDLGVAEEPVRIGPGFRVDQLPGADVLDLRLAAEPDGDFVVVWSSSESTGTDSDAESIQARRFASDGTPRGPQFQVNTLTVNSQRVPAVAVGASGEMVVTWLSTLVRLQRFDASGLPNGAEFSPDLGIPGDRRYSAVGLWDTGELVVAWELNSATAPDPSKWGIMARLFASDGSPASDAFPVNTFTTDLQERPVVAVAPSGDFVVVWQSYGSDSDFSGRSVQAQRFGSDGTALGGQFQVNSWTQGNQRYPAVAAEPSGDFVVVWESDSTAGPDTYWGIQARRYAADGTALTDEFAVNTYTPNQQSDPSVWAGPGEGDFVVAWISWHDGMVSGQARIFKAGVPIGPEFQVSQPGTSALLPKIAGTPAGLVAVWRRSPLFGEASIQAQRFAAPAFEPFVAEAPRLRSRRPTEEGRSASAAHSHRER